MDDFLIQDLNDWYSGKKIVVTGHTGFKGAWLAAWLQSAGASVTGYALAPEPDQQNLFEMSHLESTIDSNLGDICDGSTLEKVLEKSQAELVFHLAAQSLVRRSYADPIETYRTNVLGTAQLLDAVRRSPSVKAVVVVTSDKCYENNGTGHAYSEDEPMGGHDPYSSSKACAELVTSAYRRSFFSGASGPGPNVAIASARAGNVIGPGDWAPDRIMPDLMTAAANKTPAIIRNPSAVRPWQFVLEPLRGYLMLGRALSTTGSEVASGWNFGPGENDSVPVGILVDKVRKSLGSLEIRNDQTVDAPREAALLKLDSSKAAELLGWRPILSLDRSIELTVDGYKQLQRPAADVSSTMSAILTSYWNTVDEAGI